MALVGSSVDFNTGVHSDVYKRLSDAELAMSQLTVNNKFLQDQLISANVEIQMLKDDRGLVQQRLFDLETRFAWISSVIITKQEANSRLCRIDAERDVLDQRVTAIEDLQLGQRHEELLEAAKGTAGVLAGHRTKIDEMSASLVKIEHAKLHEKHEHLLGTVTDRCASFEIRMEELVGNGEVEQKKMLGALRADLIEYATKWDDMLVRGFEDQDGRSYKGLLRRMDDVETNALSNHTTLTENIASHSKRLEKQQARMDKHNNRLIDVETTLKPSKSAVSDKPTFIDRLITLDADTKALKKQQEASVLEPWKTLV